MGKPKKFTKQIAAKSNIIIPVCLIISVLLLIVIISLIIVLFVSGKYGHPGDGSRYDVGLVERPIVREIHQINGDRHIIVDDPTIGTIDVSLDGDVAFYAESEECSEKKRFIICESGEEASFYDIEIGDKIGIDFREISREFTPVVGDAAAVIVPTK